MCGFWVEGRVKGVGGRRGIVFKCEFLLQCYFLIIIKLLVVEPEQLTIKSEDFTFFQ